MDGDSNEIFIIVNDMPDELQKSQLERENETISDKNSFIWTINTTKILLDLYKKYKGEVGTMKIRNFKRMWEIIASETNRSLGVNVTPANCENRWRVLERNFKKYVDGSKKTGSERKHFDYAEEMNEILGKKRNVCPEVLLSTTSIQSALPPSTEKENDHPVQGNSADQVTIAMQKTQKKTINRRTNVKKVKNSDILEKIRTDRQKYHEQRVDFEKKKFEKCLELEQEKLKLKQKRNELLEENNNIATRRNTLLRELLDKDEDVNILAQGFTAGSN